MATGPLATPSPRTAAGPRPPPATLPACAWLLSHATSATHYLPVTAFFCLGIRRHTSLNPLFVRVLGGFINILPHHLLIPTCRKKSKGTRTFFADCLDCSIPYIWKLLKDTLLLWIFWYPFADPFADATKGDDLLPAGTEDYIHIRIQQRNGRKTLTTVQGIADDYDKKKLVKAFKKKFACNGTVIEHPEYGEVIQLQGDQRKNICQFLLEVGIVKEEQLKVHGF
uniref:Eukaryotic translation initiation factor 1b n=2 Tax=Laurasiatheria TaxID=314145 RepID=A0A9W3FSA1_CAMBA|nr:eukaryotic translation initiation factor 1b [Camelus bactrianus]